MDKGKEVAVVRSYLVYGKWEKERKFNQEVFEIFKTSKIRDLLMDMPNKVKSWRELLAFTEDKILWRSRLNSQWFMWNWTNVTRCGGQLDPVHSE